MIRRTVVLLALLTTLISGCATKPAGPDVIFFLPGVAGDGLWYNGLRDGLRDGGVSRQVITVSWGAPGPLFALNFSDKGIHDSAEQKLAKIVTEHRQKFPNGRIDLIGHSAGCGVILGAVGRLQEGSSIGRIVLISPSVSPTYDLNPVLGRCASLDSYHSTKDTTFLEWRTSHFGTYDRIKTKAAGNTGFSTSLTHSELAPRFADQSYEPAFSDLGNDGGHFGGTARRFVQKKIAPLLP